MFRVSQALYFVLHAFTWEADTGHWPYFHIASEEKIRLFVIWGNNKCSGEKESRVRSREQHSRGEVQRWSQLRPKAEKKRAALECRHNNLLTSTA